MYSTDFGHAPAFSQKIILEKQLRMKTILIATDFSKAAEDAALYAVELANIVKARVILVSAFNQVPVAVPEAPLVITLEEVQLQVAQQLTNTARQLQAHRPVAIQTCSMAGTAARAIIQAVKEFKPDLEMAGMKKKGKRIRRFFGRTVTQLIRQLSIPLLVIPEGTRFSKIKAIALANESDLPTSTDPHSMDALHELAKTFHSKLYLARVVNQHFDKAYEVRRKPARLNYMFRDLNPAFKCIEGEDTAQALTRFANLYDIDVLAIMPHRYSLLERWFIVSVTREMAFETAVPLLVIPEKQNELFN
jgi:Universal stress protein UspA and related nucleotide-binding proteins